MGRLIDVDALREAFRHDIMGGLNWDRILREAKPVDAVPVRQGRWIKKRYWSEGVGMSESYGYWYECSECGTEVKGNYGSCDDKFCKNCGADMRKDGDAHESVES